MKLALVHEYLNQYGGAERVLQVLCAQYEDSPVYTMLYDPKATGGVFADVTVRTSFLQKFPGSLRWHHAYTALMPMAVEQFDLSAFDTVLSVSASFAKGIVTKPHTRHLSYCLTPPRFLWDDSQRFVQRFGVPPLLRHASPLLLSYLRVWDRQAAERVDTFIAISQCVRERIGKYYGRESSVVYPPGFNNLYVRTIHPRLSIQRSPAGVEKPKPNTCIQRDKMRRDVASILLNATRPSGPQYTKINADVHGHMLSTDSISLTNRGISNVSACRRHARGSQTRPSNLSRTS